MPNIALIEELKNKHTLFYIGADGLEKQLLKPYIEDKTLSFFAIEAHKLVRSMTPKNLLLPFKLIKSVSQAKKLLKEIKPDLVFSKGGYVALPVVIAAKGLKIRCILHESDMTLGLSNKIGSLYADKVLTTFEPPAHSKKAIKCGAPIRQSLYEGERARGLKLMGFDGTRPVVLVMGGSLGAARLNQTVRELKNTLSGADIFVICGKGKVDESLKDMEGYAQFEYISDEMKDFFAMADLIISRAGANSICEIAALNKPNILIPLSARASRGDQILNAKSYKKQGFSEVIDEDTATAEDLVNTVNSVYENRSKYIDAMKKSAGTGGVDMIVDLINSLVK